MTTQQLVFYAFSTLLILSAGMVITTRNTVRAVLFLVLTFFAAAVLWMSLEAEFLSITLVLVYVGAVMVLFLFVVMMLDVDYAAIKDGFIRYLPLGLLVSVLVFGGISFIVGSMKFGLENYPMPPAKTADYSNVKELGRELYTDHLYAFELAAVVLLVAIIAAISLTFRGVRKRKAQNISKQLKANKANRLRIIQMPAETNQKNEV